MTFAQKLKLALEKSGMTRAELADKAGISRPMITNYLNGGYKAKQNNIFKLAKALNISEHDLIEDEYISYHSTPKHEPSAPDQELSDHDKNMVAAYNAAPEHIRKSVDTVLEPYSPVSKLDEDVYA
jgi:transcriptional regulator with XRE-family HTH domain